MTTEPHQCRSVSIPAIAPTGRKTLAQYQAEVAARFGNGNLPSWRELARRENARARHERPLREVSEAGKAVFAMCAARRVSVQQAKIDAEIVQFLQNGDSIKDIQVRSGRCWDAVRNSLKRMLDAGAVQRIGIASKARWYRIQEAAE